MKKEVTTDTPVLAQFE